jgi:hypothetical protein
MNFCSNCGTPVKPNYKFCKKCGQRLIAAETQTNSAETPNSLKKDVQLTHSNHTVANQCDQPNQSASNSANQYEKIAQRDKKIALGIGMVMILLLIAGYKFFANKVSKALPHLTVIQQIIPQTPQTGKFKAPDEPTIGKKPVAEGVITGTDVFMRQGPSTNYDDNGFFNRGERVALLEQRAGWYKVKRNNGDIAWVAAQYCHTNNGIIKADPNNQRYYLNGDTNCVFIDSWDGISFFVDRRSVKLESSSPEECVLTARIVTGKSDTPDGPLSNITAHNVKYKYTSDGTFGSNLMYRWDEGTSKYIQVPPVGNKDHSEKVLPTGEFIYGVHFHKTFYGNRADRNRNDLSALW